MIVIIPVISIVGKSNSGKTSFIEQLVPELKACGLRVAIIKHDVHGFDIDKPGKDTWRHRQAGAEMVIISSQHKVALIREVEREYSLERLERELIHDVDLILTEGYKSGTRPKIEIYRPGKYPEKLCGPEDDLITTVVNSEREDGQPGFSGEDVDRTVEMILERFFSEKRR